MEAMSSGLVPIVTNVGNLSDIVINNHNGFIVDSISIENYSDAMLCALTLNNETIDKFRSNARTTIVDLHSHTYSSSMWSKVLN
jgi:glycosyltransferase involved in cell wall biosynthesis